MTQHVQRERQSSGLMNIDGDEKTNPRIRRLLAERRRQKAKQQHRTANHRTPNDATATRDDRSPISATVDEKFVFQLPSPNTISRMRDPFGSISLSNGLSAARADPFKTLPVQWTPDLDENFDFLVNSFGPSMFGYRRNDQRIDIFHSQAQLTLADPAAFHALMTISVQSRDRFSGRMLPGVSAVWHRVEALRLVNERFARADPEECLTEGSLFAVMCLTGISRQWNAVGDDEFQSTGLDRLILKKGGMSVLGEQHPVLELAIFCLATLTHGMLRPDLYAVGGLDASLLEDMQDSKSLLYSLLGFVRSVGTLQAKNAEVIQSVRFAFGPNTDIYRLLTDPPPTPGLHPEKMDNVHNRLKHQVLLYVFSVLIYGTPGMFATFIQHLQYILKQVWIWKDSLRMLQWILVANPSSGTLVFSKPAWQSYEQLCAVGSMKKELQSDVRNFLLTVLTGHKFTSMDSQAVLSRIRSQMFGAQSPVDK